MERSRTFTWSDPLEAAQRGFALSGADSLRAVADGEIPMPPIAQMMGFEPVEAGEGRVVIAVEPAEYHYSNTGAVHGGLASTMLDSAMYLAVHSTLDAGTFASTLEIKVNYVRPMTDRTGRVTCEGTLVHRGRTVATAEGRIVDERGKLYAHGVTTCMIVTPGA